MSILDLTINLNWPDEGFALAQKVTSFLFQEILFAKAVFVVGAVFAIFQTIRGSNYRPLIVYFILSFTLFTQYQNLPFLLKTLDESSDGVIDSVINVVDPAYFARPFAIQKDSLRINRQLHIGMIDGLLERRVDKFIHDSYLPAFNLAMHSNDSSLVHELWPGHAKIVQYYSTEAKRIWMDIQREISSRETISVVNYQPQRVQDALVKSVIDYKLRQNALKLLPDQIWLGTAYIISFFSLLPGSITVLLYLLLPFLLLFLLIKQSLKVVVYFLSAFAWAKLCALSSFVSYLMSKLVFDAQRAASPLDPRWVWEQPYYAVIAAAGLVTLPVILMFVIKQGGLNEKGVSYFSSLDRSR